MTLREMLKTLKDDTIASIGAASGYMYIGSCKNLDEIEQTFDKFCQKQKDNYTLMKTLRRQNKRLNGNRIVTKKMLDKKAIYISTYTSPLDRAVLTTYKRECAPGIGIKVTGLERGRL